MLGCVGGGWGGGNSVGKVREGRGVEVGVGRSVVVEIGGTMGGG